MSYSSVELGTLVPFADEMEEDVKIRLVLKRITLYIFSIFIILSMLMEKTLAIKRFSLT